MDEGGGIALDVDTYYAACWFIGRNPALPQDEQHDMFFLLSRPRASARGPWQLRLHGRDYASADPQDPANEYPTFVIAPAQPRCGEPEAMGFARETATHAATLLQTVVEEHVIQGSGEAVLLCLSQQPWAHLFDFPRDTLH